MKQHISMEEARAIVIGELQEVNECEAISVFDAVGRVAGKEYLAVYNQPPFDRSPLDGFAVRHEDICTANKDNGVTLKIAYYICAGDDYRVTLQPGEAARIMTGAGIPYGTDCVIRQEDVEYTEKTATFYQSMKAHDNICDAGEDLKAGSCIIQKGDCITPAHGAILAGQGYFQISCKRKLSIGVISTGSELVQAEENQQRISLQEGKIFNSNGPMLGMRLQELGMQATCLCCGDQPEEIKKYILELLKQHDVVITTGGVSVGDKDYLPGIMEEMGAEILFHGIAMKPGSPMLVAKMDGKVVCCLSGNPFAAMATFELIVVPGLGKASGRKRYMPKQQIVQVMNPFLKSSKKGRRLIRAKIEDKKAIIPQNHSSGSIASMLGCNGFLDIPAGYGNINADQLLHCIMLFQDQDAVSSETSVDVENTLQQIIEKKKTQNQVPILCICGTKNVGKTTFMEKIIVELARQGYHVAAIKHDGHQFVPDVPETDSARFFQAGAGAVTVYSKNMLSMYESLTEEMKISISTVLAKLNEFTKGKYDLVLIEGLKEEPYPKIEIVREEIATETVSNKQGLLAICSDFEMKKEENMTYFSLEDVKEVVKYIKENIMSI